MFGIQFLNLSALFIAAAAPLLIFAYREKLQRTKVVVSSLMILQELQRRPLQRKKIKLPLSFIFELLALLALAAAAANPVRDSSAKKAALVVDNSLSMSAGTAVAGASRLELGKRQLQRWIDDDSRSAGYALFTLSPKLTRIGDDLSASEASRRLSTIRAARASDNLAPAVRELGESGAFERIVLVTDHQVELAENDETGAGGKTEVERIAVGEPADNVFINGFRSERAGLSGGVALTAGIALAAAAPREMSVKFFGSRAGGDYEPLGTSTVKVEPGRSEEATVKLAPGSERYLIFRAEILPPKTAGTVDAIDADNTAYRALEEQQGAAVLLVSPVGSPQNLLGLELIPGLNVRKIAPPDLSRLAANGDLQEELRKFSVVIFHQSAPAELNKTATLLIMPPPGNSMFPVVKDVSAPRITSWASSHPITTYLKLALLAPSASAVLAVPEWGQTVINAEAGPIVVAGEPGGVRHAAVGFELLPFEGARTPVSTVLTLNLLQWLNGGAGIEAGLVTGSSLKLEGGREWEIFDPAGGAQTAGSLNDKEPLSIEANEPGIWFTRSSKPPRQAKVFAVNAFHPQESSTLQRDEVELPGSFPRKLQAQTAERLESILLWAVLAFLFAELALRLLRRKRGKGAAVMEAAYS